MLDGDLQSVPVHKQLYFLTQLEQKYCQQSSIAKENSSSIGCHSLSFLRPSMAKVWQDTISVWLLKKV